MDPIWYQVKPKELSISQWEEFVETEKLLDDVISLGLDLTVEETYRRRTNEYQFRYFDIPWLDPHLSIYYTLPPYKGEEGKDIFLHYLQMILSVDIPGGVEKLGLYLLSLADLWYIERFLEATEERNQEIHRDEIEYFYRLRKEYGRKEFEKIIREEDTDLSHVYFEVEEYHPKLPPKLSMETVITELDPRLVDENIDEIVEMTRNPYDEFYVFWYYYQQGRENDYFTRARIITLASYYGCLDILIIMLILKGNNLGNIILKRLLKGEYINDEIISKLYQTFGEYYLDIFVD